MLDLNSMRRLGIGTAEDLPKSCGAEAIVVSDVQTPVV